LDWTRETFMGPAARCTDPAADLTSTRPARAAGRQPERWRSCPSRSSVLPCAPPAAFRRRAATPLRAPRLSDSGRPAHPTQVVPLPDAEYALGSASFSRLPADHTAAGGFEVAVPVDLGPERKRDDDAVGRRYPKPSSVSTAQATHRDRRGQCKRMPKPCCKRSSTRAEVSHREDRVRCPCEGEYAR
jgi:hypothetical protein